MEHDIAIKEDSIVTAVKVNSTILEFGELDKTYFENRYKNFTNLILGAYVEGVPAGYLVAYDRDSDGSFYCWITGVDPKYRRMSLLSQMMQYLFYLSQAKRI